MAPRFSQMCSSFVLLAASLLLLLKGCSMWPTEFETFELDFRDTLKLQAPGQEVFIVLEQLPDGPVSRYEDVTYEVTASNLLTDSLLLTLDVVGLASEPTPTAFKEARLEADTHQPLVGERRLIASFGDRGKILDYFDQLLEYLDRQDDGSSLPGFIHDILRVERC